MREKRSVSYARSHYYSFEVVSSYDKKCYKLMLQMYIIELLEFLNSSA